jgi:hypothetical protein
LVLGLGLPNSQTGTELSNIPSNTLSPATAHQGTNPNTRVLDHLAAVSRPFALLVAWSTLVKLRLRDATRFGAPLLCSKRVDDAAPAQLPSLSCSAALPPQSCSPQFARLCLSATDPRRPALTPPPRPRRPTRCCVHAPRCHLAAPCSRHEHLAAVGSHAHQVRQRKSRSLLPSLVRFLR